MTFAEAHHLWGSGAVIFPDGFQAFEQIAFEFYQFGIKAFAGRRKRRTMKDLKMPLPPGKISPRALKVKFR